MTARGARDLAPVCGRRRRGRRRGRASTTVALPAPAVTRAPTPVISRRRRRVRRPSTRAPRPSLAVPVSLEGTVFEKGNAPPPRRRQHHHRCGPERRDRRVRGVRRAAFARTSRHRDPVSRLRSRARGARRRRSDHPPHLAARAASRRPPVPDRRHGAGAAAPDCAHRRGSAHRARRRRRSLSQHRVAARRGATGVAAGALRDPRRQPGQYRLLHRRHARAGAVPLRARPVRGASVPDRSPRLLPRRAAGALGGYVSGAVSAGIGTPPSDLAHASVDLRVYDIGGLVTTPFDQGRGTLAIAGRYSYTGALASLFFSDVRLGYADYQVHLDAPVRRRSPDLAGDGFRRRAGAARERDRRRSAAIPPRSICAGTTSSAPVACGCAGRWGPTGRARTCATRRSRSAPTRPRRGSSTALGWLPPRSSMRASASRSSASGRRSHRCPTARRWTTSRGRAAHPAPQLTCRWRCRSARASSCRRASAWCATPSRAWCGSRPSRASTRA